MTKAGTAPGAHREGARKSRLSKYTCSARSFCSALCSRELRTFFDARMAGIHALGASARWMAGAGPSMGGKSPTAPPLRARPARPPAPPPRIAATTSLRALDISPPQLCYQIVHTGHGLEDSANGADTSAVGGVERNVEPRRQHGIKPLRLLPHSLLSTSKHLLFFVSAVG